jgi:hypothetical protein
MLWHPILIGVWLTDLSVALLMLSAAWTALKMTVAWRPDAPSADQLRLERSAEDLPLKARWAALLLLAATVLLAVALTNVLPAHVPGAMCATGVLQAMGSAGRRLLTLRGMALLALFICQVIGAIDRHEPRSLLAPAMARAILIAQPPLWLSQWAFLEAINRLRPHAAVDCCALLYERSGGLAGRPGSMPITDAFWMALLLAASAGVLALAARIRWGRPPQRSVMAGGLALLAGFWCVLAATCLKKVFAGYIYQVPSHECLYCLFLLQHGAVGFPIFGALAMVLAEGLACWTAALIGERRRPLADAARQRASSAALRIMAASVAFLIMAGMPALLWRWRFGVWIG